MIAPARLNFLEKYFFGVKLQPAPSKQRKIAGKMSFKKPNLRLGFDMKHIQDLRSVLVNLKLLITGEYTVLQQCLKIVPSTILFKMREIS